MARNVLVQFISGIGICENHNTLNEGQHVNAADAASLADALDLVLLDPDTDSDARQTTMICLST